MMYSAYVSASSKRKEVALMVMNLLRRGGIAITLDWTREEGDSVPEDARKMYFTENAMRDIEAVKRADVVIAIVDPECPSLGTWTEIGAALVLDKPVLIVGGPEIWAGSGLTVFAHHPNVHAIENYSSLLEAISCRKP
jgi:nucleoside 2-deoxyribosyltransferase-like protein